MNNQSCRCSLLLALLLCMVFPGSVLAAPGTKRPPARPVTQKITDIEAVALTLRNIPDSYYPLQLYIRLRRLKEGMVLVTIYDNSNSHMLHPWTAKFWVSPNSVRVSDNIHRTKQSPKNKEGEHLPKIASSAWTYILKNFYHYKENSSAQGGLRELLFSIDGGPSHYIVYVDLVPHFSDQMFTFDVYDVVGKLKISRALEQ